MMCWEVNDLRLGKGKKLKVLPFFYLKSCTASKIPSYIPPFFVVFDAIFKSYH